MDGANCNGVNNADDPNDWQGGWIVFLNPTSAQNPPNAGSVIRVQAPFSSLDTFVPFNANFGAITFNREGYAATQNAQTVTLQLHDSTKNPAWTRCLAITTVGMLTTQRVGAAAPACT
jgi:Tfp pilus assembly protein FimT